ncbi:RAE1 [Auxenochlorella protothecoides x Auxenochlorella symbiontica]|nr:Rae1-like protein [Auxenochlorella protothecoides]KFM24542.1 Rae1-like protein [Auxenochlorella protothecoides]
MASYGALSFGAAGNYNPNKDAEVTSPPSDGVSSLNFSPVSNHLVATSWSGQTLCWEVQSSGQAVPKAAIQSDKPVLCSAWNADGSAVFAGGCDNGVKMWNLATNQQQQVAAHAEPVRHCAYVPHLSMLVTGSWDRTLKYWDLRTPNPVHTQQLPDKCYALSTTGQLLVVGTADRVIQVYNLQAPQQVYKQIHSPLKFQTRCLACFPDATGYLVGSVEGRVAVHHVEESQKDKNFTFKCHRPEKDVFPVNSLNFHPQYGTFASAGGDGSFSFWDKDSKQRLKAFSAANAPIPCTAYSKDGSIFAYAVSYDWMRGAQEHNPATAKNHILLHPVTEAEAKSKPRSTTTRR